MKELHAYYNGNDTLFAYDKEDALKVLEESYGKGYLEGSEDTVDSLTEITDMEQPYTLYTEDMVKDFKFPEGGIKVNDSTIKATIGAWKNSIGRGFLGSENY